MTQGRLLAAALLATTMTSTASAQEARVEALDITELGDLRIIKGTITGYETVDYTIGVERSQIISVDLLSSNPSLNFNILPEGEREALFIGSTEGTVADIPAPSASDYVIRVYLVRAAARRSETANYSLGVSVGAPEYADGLFGGPDYWQVSGIGGGDALNLRAGPSTRYSVEGKLRNGDVLENRGCRLTGSDRWCRIRTAGSGVTGWVAGRFLVETAPPPAPQTPDGGPVGNGTGFDATGFVNCATAAEAPLRQCPFGVIREGSGNAGVWIALGDGVERHILFESGTPAFSSGTGDLSFERRGDLYVIRVGSERFEFPEAVVYGG